MVGARADQPEAPVRDYFRRPSRSATKKWNISRNGSIVLGRPGRLACAEISQGGQDRV